MKNRSDYPRVLIVTLGKINNNDNSNNGLLLRNLFGSNWPKKNIAQIYSGGDNGDCGFFGNYYQLKSCDRFFGKFFYKTKEQKNIFSNEKSTNKDTKSKHQIFIRKFINSLKSYALESGLYEFIFHPRPSKKMLNWVDEFDPQIILCQGYNLTFSWLPLMLCKRKKTPLVFYPTDDWPTDLYKSSSLKWNIVEKFIRSQVKKSAINLVRNSTINIAFNEFMKTEYEKRYNKSFQVLMHGDLFERYPKTTEKQSACKETYTIVTTGVFNNNRQPLIADIDKACELLLERGISASVHVYSVNTLTESDTTNKSYSNVKFFPCPSHDELSAILSNSDLLWLPERFDNTSEDIRLCISSKAHLFMFSGSPILVYSDRKTDRKSVV